MLVHDRYTLHRGKTESTHWVGANSQRLPKVISITYSIEWVPPARLETPRSTLVSGLKWSHAVVTSTGDTVTRIPKRGDLPCSRHIGMGSVGTHICCSQRGSQSENHGVTHRRVSLSIIHTESALEDGRSVRRSYDEPPIQRGASRWYYPPSDECYGPV